uniref:Uncharacterized protein n=1 Tax=Arundo donax TaxID=35708 RepID=A0A0A9ELN6_ARUDO
MPWRGRWAGRSWCRSFGS